MGSKINCVLSPFALLFSAIKMELMLLTGLGNPWSKSNKYFHEEMSKQGFQSICSLKLCTLAPHTQFSLQQKVTSLFKKNSWLCSNTQLSHSDEANYLQWTVCLWDLALVASLQIVHGQLRSWWILWNYSNIYWEQISALGVFLFVCFVWCSSYAPVGLSNARGTE